jgi:hypothetical protein
MASDKDAAMTDPQCRGTNADGAPCQSPSRFLDVDGYCEAHRPGGREFMRTIGTAGGEATRAKYGARPFTEAELVPLTDAAGATSQVYTAVMCGRLTHAQGNVALKAIEVQLKAEAAAREQRLVDELYAKQETLERENRDLRQQVATLQREKRVA